MRGVLNVYSPHFAFILAVVLAALLILAVAVFVRENSELLAITSYRSIFALPIQAAVKVF